MSRPLRLQFPGALYHITSRGDGRESIYLDDRDRMAFLATLAQVCERYSWVCHSYCLMTNHYHLMIETLAPSLARGMRQLNGVYTQDFNRAHQRVGHVYQGRYAAVLVQKERHLLEVMRYIVLNPVRAHMVRTAGDWTWSSYRATVGLAPSPPWLKTDGVEAIFGAGAKGRRRFIEFVQDGIGAPSCWQHLTHQIYLGDSAFVSSALDRIGMDAHDASHLSEVPMTQRCVRPAPARRWETQHPPAQPLAGQAPTRSSLAERNRAIIDSFATGDFTMRAIGEHFGLHYSRVSRIISAAERARRKTSVLLRGEERRADPDRRSGVYVPTLPSLRRNPPLFCHTRILSRLAASGNQ
jgi:putative transposase